jgi:hypothetical protein
MDIRLLIGGYLYITIAVIFIIYMLKRIIKKEGFTAIDKALPVIILGTGFLYIIALAFHYSEEIGLSNKLQILLMFGLVAVTTFYAWSASRQADASVRMAKETREQRYSESLPLLVPTVPPILNTDKLPYESLQSGVGVKVLWRNLGKGVAINSRVSFETLPTSTGKATFFPPRKLGTVEVGGKKEVDYSEILDDGQLHDISDAYQPRVKAEYLDIYERRVTTVQEFRVDEQNKKPFLGELYFTINGRRLGEEVTHHD